MCHDLFSESVIKNRGFFNPEAVQAIWRGFQDGQSGQGAPVYWPQVWLLLMTEVWAQNVLDVAHA
jgi:hypothetical protein